MSSELLPALRRAGRTILVLSTLALLAGCQVRPLYSSAGTVPGKLAAVKISAADDRVEQNVRNRLVFLLNGGSGEPAQADYQLQMNVSAVRANILDDEISTALTPGRVTVTVTYALIATRDSKVLKSATRSVTSLVDIGYQEFSKLRAYRDAEDRASRELAEVIRADLAAILGRQD
ncbi:LPS assembly lipoprotein LptE [Rhizobium sp. SSA_523]|uniref:LPS assembly lipoprotein LptE n=1 Tax=Rhizobium sp. SSA_523 TaxID=2952477 RepID=UPI002090C1EE|nr:LPS assembly lipoprotein LptE [Rhizobium sp. SSA_523]MCO5734610.1 LPS assembly lipoprotein LptE [Rhizobium sp. SSA_523]WKC23386.1 LPS assembly lipoprotein LptE [Rhizobium sp. SSA_523]